MNFNWLIPLLIGAVIGYITNDIAIKMLFHPRKAYYIGKRRDAGRNFSGLVQAYGRNKSRRFDRGAQDRVFLPVIDPVDAFRLGAVNSTEEMVQAEQEHRSKK